MSNQGDELSIAWLALLAPIAALGARVAWRYLKKRPRIGRERNVRQARPFPSKDELRRLSEELTTQYGIHVVCTSNATHLVAEVWQLDPDLGDWRLVARSAQPLTGRGVPSLVLLSGHLARLTANLEASGWPCLRLPDLPVE